VLNQVAQGQLTGDAVPQISVDEMGKMSTDINSMLHTLHDDKGAGRMIDMRQPEQGQDVLNDEFERF
jgi:hypothetical protein